MTAAPATALVTLDLGALRLTAVRVGRVTWTCTIVDKGTQAQLASGVGSTEHEAIAVAKRDLCELWDTISVALARKVW